MKCGKADGFTAFLPNKGVSRAALIPLFAILLSLVLSEPPSMLFMAAGAIILHEFGHVLVLFIITKEIPVLHLEGFGLRLMPARPLLPLEELAAALGGPLFNTLLGILFCRLGEEFFFSMGAMQFLFAFFNLLPYENSDGGRILHLLFLRLFPQKTARGVSVFISGAVLSFFYFLSLYVFYFTGNGLCGVFFAVFSFPWHHLESGNDF